MKILLVEDDRIIGENIKEYLEENNFLVCLKTDGLSGWKEAQKNTYDIFVFDIMLPYMNGIEIITQLKQEKNTTPIILLTAKEDIETKEKGFLSGADDYITKPFALKELLLRIKNLQRRVYHQNDFHILQSGDIQLNLDLKEVHRNGRLILLTPKEFYILEYLMRHENKVVKKQELLEYLWGIHHDIWSDVVRTHIASLRSKLNQGGEYNPIVTLRGIGFKFQKYEQ